MAAGDMHFRRDEVADLDAGDGVADGCNGAAELMAGNVGRLDAVLRPLVPMEDVEVCAADGSSFDGDEHIVGAEGGDWDFAHLHAWRGGRLNQGTHGFRQ